MRVAATLPIDLAGQFFFESRIFLSQFGERLDIVDRGRHLFVWFEQGIQPFLRLDGFLGLLLVVPEAWHSLEGEQLVALGQFDRDIKESPGDRSNGRSGRRSFGAVLGSSKRILHGESAAVSGVAE